METIQVLVGGTLLALRGFYFLFFILIFWNNLLCIYIAKETNQHFGYPKLEVSISNCLNHSGTITTNRASQDSKALDLQHQKLQIKWLVGTWSIGTKYQKK